MRKLVQVCAVLTVAAGPLAVSVLPASAHHVDAYAKADQTCRDSIAKSFARTVSSGAKVSNTCHKNRDKGKLAAASDCNDLSQADTKLKFRKAQASLVDTITKLCLEGGASETLLEEFTSCPEPCNTETGISNPIAGYAELGTCLACLAGDVVERTNREMMGSPAAPLSSEESACHAAIARGYWKRLNTILKERGSCQKNEDAAKNTDLKPCDSADPNGKIEGALSVAEAGVDASCIDTAIARLNSCGATSGADLKGCLHAQNDVAAAEAFSSSFRLPATICPVQVNSKILAGWTEGGRQSDTSLELGWTGLVHDADLGDGFFLSTDITCPNVSPPCGDCTVKGLSANGPQYATFTRCSSDFSVRCSAPFQRDYVHCGGAECVYVLGPPLPISGGNSPTCSINALQSDIAGTVNPDAGTSSIDLRFVTKTHVGGSITLTHPCPVCVGDDVAADGLKDGACRGGSQDGQPCDVDAYDATFAPQSRGEGLALDCPPSPSTNITGVGMRIPFVLTTGRTELAFENKCDTPLSALECACGICTGDPTLSCRNTDECAAAGAGTCASKGNGVGRVPNGCRDVIAGCVAAGDNKGECADPAENMAFCDGVVRANGNGIVGCATDGDCQSSDCDDVTPGLQVGSCGSACAMSQPRPCFLNPIVDEGFPSTREPSLVGTFCLAPTSNAAINSVTGNPGPARMKAQMLVQLSY